MSPIERPIFVIGTGRSGLSPLMDLVSYHPSLGWPNNWHHRLPARIGTAATLARVHDMPVLGPWLKFRKRVPEHSEAWKMWSRLYPGFVEPGRDLVASDATPALKQTFRSAVSRILHGQNKTRFIAELSGWSRVRFLRQIFPDAQFVHIVRDGRAVANSLTNVGYWRGWEGPQAWRWGPLPPADHDAYERYDRAPLGLAGLQWKLLIKNIVGQLEQLPSADALQLRYEDLVAQPERVALAISNFCKLDVDAPGYREHVHHVASERIVNANAVTMRIPSWRKNMSQDQVAMLDDLLGTELKLHGYL